MPIIVLGQSTSSPCCASKMVGGSFYILSGQEDTSKWGCKDSCVYTSFNGGKVCFKAGGSQMATCLDGGMGGNGTGGGGWPTEPEVQYNYTAKGELVDLAPGMKGYVVGSGKKAVVWNYDSFGLTGELQYIPISKSL